MRRSLRLSACTPRRGCSSSRTEGVRCQGELYPKGRQGTFQKKLFCFMCLPPPPWQFYSRALHNGRNAFSIMVPNSNPAAPAGPGSK